MVRCQGRTCFEEREKLGLSDFFLTIYTFVFNENLSLQFKIKLSGRKTRQVYIKEEEMQGGSNLMCLSGV